MGSQIRLVKANVHIIYSQPVRCYLPLYGLTVRYGTTLITYERT